jgi:hypothetical protein
MLFGFMVATGACGSRSAGESSSATTEEPLKECLAYAEAHKTCFATLGPEGARLMERRFGAVRAELERTPTDEAERSAMRERCASGAKHLAAACR